MKSTAIRYIVAGIGAAGLLYALSFLAVHLSSPAKVEDDAPATFEPEFALTEALPEWRTDARVLVVFVEMNGVSVGDDFVGFGDFRGFLEERSATWRADCALVLGTTDTKFGAFVQVFATLRDVVSVPTRVSTVLVDRNRRFPAVNVGQLYDVLRPEAEGAEPGATDNPDSAGSQSEKSSSN